MGSAGHLNQFLIFLIVQVSLKEIDRVDVLTMIQHFIMQVRPPRKSGISYISDNFSALYQLIVLDIKLRQMRITRFIPVHVIDKDDIAETLGVIRIFNFSIACS